jgi:predicted thioesterase
LEQGEGTRVAFSTVAVAVGASGQLELRVGPADTAVAQGTGAVPVLATPRLIQLCEAATLEALGPAPTTDNTTTVGLRVEVSHVAPVAVGSVVRATAVLERCEGRRLIFNVSVNDDCGLVAAGRITRVIIDLATFMEKVR